MGNSGYSKHGACGVLCSVERKPHDSRVHLLLSNGIKKLLIEMEKSSSLVVFNPFRARLLLPTNHHKF